MAAPADPMRAHAWPLLLAANFFGRLGNEFIRSPVLPLFVISVGGGMAWVGVIGALAGLVGTVVRLPLGAAMDAGGPRRLLVAGGAVFTAVPPAYLAVGALPWLIALRSLHAVAPALFSPASMALAARPDPDRAAQRVGWVAGIKSLASVGGGLAGGWLLHVFGFGGAFIASSVAGAGALACALALPRGQAAPDQAPGPGDRPLRGARVRAGLQGVARSSWAAARDAGLWLLALPGVWACVVQASAIVFIPALGAAHGWPVLWLGGLVAVHHLVLALIGPLAGGFVDRAGPLPATAAGFICAAAGLAAIWLWPAPWTAALAAASAACAAATAEPGSLVAMRARSRHADGATIGLWSTAMDLGEAAGSLVTGMVAAFVGVGAAFGVWAGFSLIGASMVAVAAWRPARSYERFRATCSSTIPPRAGA